MDFECYDAYGSYAACSGDEMNKIAVDEVVKTALALIR